MKRLKTNLILSIMVLLLFVGSGCSNNTNKADDDGGVSDDYAIEELLAKAGYESFEDLIQDEDVWYREIRFQSWVGDGGDSLEIQYALALMASYGPAEDGYFDTHGGEKSWIMTWTGLANIAGEEAEEFLEEGKNVQARKRFLRAALYFDTAAYPHNPFDEDVKNTYGEATEAYVAAAELCDAYTLEELTLTVEEKSVIALLHLPGGNNLPVVIAQKGLDTSRITLEDMAYMFAEEGIAMVTIDTNGSGASRELLLQPDDNAVHRVLVEELKNHPQLDGERIAIYGQSVGGHASTRAAYDLEESLVAAVNVCGPVHSIWTYPMEAYMSFPDMLMDSLGWRLGYPEGKAAVEEFFPILIDFSLENQGFLGQETNTSVPILNINTSNDDICTVEDMNLVADSSDGGEVVIIEGDGGEGDNHCPAAEDFMPVVLEWLNAKITE
jgi:hypothetical protein